MGARADARVAPRIELEEAATRAQFRPAQRWPQHLVVDHRRPQPIINRAQALFAI